MSNKAIILDANILIRTVLFQFALKTITALLRLAVLQHCLRLRALFSFLMQIGIKERIDFFGSGIATWATDRVEIYLGG